MSEERGPGSSAADPLLRAIACAPSRPIEGLIESDPVRVANFRVLGRLGSGGMGIVYRAQDESLRREVALKVLPPVHARDSERRQRFLREARSAAALVHPNVAVVYQIGEVDGRDYFAMELVEGVTLRLRLEKGALSAPAARDLSLQMAQGLAAAHNKRIVHRDLKPENVMVTDSGVVKLLDFGLAKGARSGESDAEFEEADTEAQITRDGLVVGSSAYMSPEQAFGLPVDPRSDVFSFGIVLYEMLAGRRPFAGKTVGEVRAAIARDVPLPLAGVNGALERVAMRCLAKRPEDRFDDAAAIVRVLSVPLATAGGRGRTPPVSFSRDPSPESAIQPIDREPSVSAGKSEVKGLWFVVARRYLIEKHDPELPDRMAERVDPALREAILEPMRSVWYPEACLQQFMRAFDEVVTRGDQRRLIQAFEECTVQGLHRYFRAALRLTSPDFLLRKAPVLWNHVRRNQGSINVETNAERAIVRYTDFPYFHDVNYRLLARGTLRQLAAFGREADPRAQEVGFGKDWLTVEVRYR